MNEQVTHSSGAGRFGRNAQEQSATAQKLSAPPVERSAVIVVTSPVAGIDKVFASLLDESVNEFAVNTKAVERLTDLLNDGSYPDGESAYNVLHSEGTVVAIDERYTQQGATAVVLRYVSALSANQMYGLISRSLFLRMSQTGDANMTDVAARYGIHAICVVAESEMHKVVNALVAQLDSISDAGRIVPFTTVPDETLASSVIDWSSVPAQPLVALEGEVRNMLFANANSELFGIRSEGDQQVSNKDIMQAATIGDEEFDDNDELENEDEDGEVPTGSALFGYDNESLSNDQRIEALESIGYDCSAFDEESVSESFMLEQAKYLASEGDEDSDVEDDEEDSDNEESEDDESEDESDDEESDDDQDDEEEEDEEGPSLGEQVAEILLDAELDRDQAKKLVYMLGLKVLKADTVESLIAKILEEVDTWTEAATMTQFVLDANAKLGGHEVFAAWLFDNSEEADADSDDDQDEESDDDLSAFSRNAGELTHEERSEALRSVGIDPTGLNMVRVMKLFKQTQTQRGIQIEDAVLEPVASDAALIGEDDAEADETIDQFMSRIALTPVEELTAEEKVRAISEYDGTDMEENDEELDEMFEVVIKQYLSDQSALLLNPSADALTEILNPSFTPVEDDADEDWEDEDPEDQDNEADDENYALDGDDESNVDHAAFLSDVEETEDGELVSVTFEQHVVVNLVLTNRNSFVDNNEELVNIDGINYRFPFLPKQEGKGTGAMLLPMANVVELMENLSTSRMLVDTSTFDVHNFADKLRARLNKQMVAGLYEGRIEEGSDPEVEGIVLGDFVEDEALEDEDSLFSAEDLEMLGQHSAMPIAQLYNGVIGVRPVAIEGDSLMINAAVVNFMVPGFWSIEETDKIENMLNAAINQVTSRIADTTDLKVYVAFTVDSSAIVSDESVFAAVTALRNMDGAQVYSKADAELLQTNDIFAAAASLDERDLPLTLLASDVAGHTFAMGGDLTVLFACFEEDEEEDELDEDEESDEE